MPKTLLLAVSAHGLGHLGQTAPLLTALHSSAPALNIKLLSSLPYSAVEGFIPEGVEYLTAPEHVTIAMHGPLSVDIAKTKTRFTQWHANYEQHLKTYGDILDEHAPDLVISNIDYTILGAAHRAGIPAFALCSLNWADILRPLVGADPAMLGICDEIAAVYCLAKKFIRVSPGMDMPSLDNVVSVGPLARSGRSHPLRKMLKLPDDSQLLMFSLGGVEQKLDISEWQLPKNSHCIVPNYSMGHSAQFTRLADTDLSYIDALTSVDVLVTKPGYGNFCEAWRNKTALVYTRREAWPEESALIKWIQTHCPAAELTQSDYIGGKLCVALDTLGKLPATFTQTTTGEPEILRLLAPYL